MGANKQDVETMALDAGKFLNKNQDFQISSLLSKPNKNKNKIKFRSDIEGKSSPDQDQLAEQPSANRQSTVSQPSVNRQLTVSQPSVNRQSTVSQPSVNRQSTVGQPSANRWPTVGQPSVEKPLNIDLNSLSGKKLKFIKFIFAQCRISGELKTNIVTNEVLKNTLSTSFNSIRTLIWELKKDGYIDYETLKKGRIGMRRFILSKEIYKQCIISSTVGQPLANRQPTVGQPSVMGPSSSILLEFKDTNTTSTNSPTEIDKESWADVGEEFPIKKVEDDNEWELIQTPEFLKKLGFGGKHIKSMRRNFDLSASEIQESLEMYNHDLMNGKLEQLKSMGKNPISFFFGCIKRGGYNLIHEGFQTIEELAESIEKKGEELRIEEYRQNARRESLEREMEKLKDLKKEIETKKKEFSESGIDVEKKLRQPKIRNARDASFTLDLTKR